ncbi:MAG: transglutaminase family protein [Cyanobacteria bacterium J06638_7]
MQRYRIEHSTTYSFDAAVWLNSHALRLRPREGHELRIESSRLRISPPATLRWHRDAENNSVAIATFNTMASSLTIESEVVLQQYQQEPFDFLLDPMALLFPFPYRAEEVLLLGPYRQQEDWNRQEPTLEHWLNSLYEPGERVQTFSLLERINNRIESSLRYAQRLDPGVQTPAQTLSCGSGSCRDFATLFMATARRLGLAARFVSGYLHDPIALPGSGSTHAWVEVYLPGAGWKGFDPTTGTLAGPDHFAVAVARRPEAVPPVAGSYRGQAGAGLSVGVWVSLLG